MTTSEPMSVFLAGAHAVACAIADPAVADGWDRPSVLEDQRVSGLAGHLARGGVWVVADYLDGGEPSGGVDFDNAGEYFAAFLRSASPQGHQDIRDRGAAVAAVGHQALVGQLDERLNALETRLRSMDPTRLVAVVAGRVMRIGDYVVTRIVEQAVHLDDLARSVSHDPWPYPVEGQDLAIDVGVDIGRRGSGRSAVLRALYRRGFTDGTLPVL